MTTSFGAAYTAGLAAAFADRQQGLPAGAHLLFLAAGPGINVAAALYKVPAPGSG